MYNFRLNGRDFHFRVIDLTQWKLPPNCGRPIVFLRTRPTSPFRHQHRCREKAVFIFIAPCVLIMTGIGGRLISMMMILLLYSRIIISNTSRHDAAIISSLVPVVLFLPPFVFRHDHACDDPLDASIPTHERENFFPFFRRAIQRPLRYNAAQQQDGRGFWWGRESVDENRWSPEFMAKSISSCSTLLLGGTAAFVAAWFFIPVVTFYLVSRAYIHIILLVCTRGHSPSCSPRAPDYRRWAGDAAVDIYRRV